MRQRVGFARAMVVHPNILLMDEPFSALDVLTAENLRTDFLELWGEKQLPIKGVILVTHNIEEAVLMCDRVLLFSTNPGRIAGEIKIDIPRPRDRTDPRFEHYVDQIYTEMTARQRSARIDRGTGLGMLHDPCLAEPVSGLIEAVAAAPYNGKADLPDIASDLQMEIDELFPVAEALQTVAAGRAGRRRHQAHPYGQALRRRRDERAQGNLLPRPDEPGAAGRAYPPGARRTHQPHRAHGAASSTSWKIT